MLTTLLLSMLLLLRPSGACANPAPVAQPAFTQSSDDTMRDEYRLPELLKALDLKAGSIAADLGCGDGKFTVPMARAATDKGSIYAIDINKDALTSLRQRLEREHVTNVKVVQGKEDDPLLPENQLDSVLIMNAYH